MKQALILISIFTISITSFSQHITAQIIDKNTKKPLPYATIKTGDYSGVISNEEGYFTIHMLNENLQTIIISCLGYQSKTIRIDHMKALNFKIQLEEQINQLNEVYISNKNPNADSIISRVKSRISINYHTELYKYSIFRRVTNDVDFGELKFEIDKASHFSKKNMEDANVGLRTLSKKIRESNMKYFTDFKGELYSLNKDSSKLVVNKATKLIDYKNDFSIEDIQEKAQSIVLTYLDTTKTYKLKTGFFMVEDSLSLNDGEFKKEQKEAFTLKHLNKQTKTLLQHTQFYENSFLNTLLNSDLYEYTFEGMTHNNSELTYIINFEPRKGKAKYAGTFFISHDTYAITKVDYGYYKNRHGSKLNLKLILGVKYIENVSEGIILFEKTIENKYQPKYIKRTMGSYFYVSRGLKFIENSSTKNKVSFDFTLEGNNRNKEELLFTKNTPLTLQDFTALKQDSIAPYKVLNTFEKTLWENEEILEPLKEMKTFEVKE